MDRQTVLDIIETYFSVRSVKLNMWQILKLQKNDLENLNYDYENLTNLFFPVFKFINFPKNKKKNNDVQNKILANLLDSVYDIVNAKNLSQNEQAYYVIKYFQLLDRMVKASKTNLSIEKTLYFTQNY